MTTFIFLLLMELGGVYGGLASVFPFLTVLGGVYGSGPPFIPFLTVAKDGEVERVFTNRSLQYSTQPFTTMEIVCEAESDEDEDVSYFWNMLDIDLSKADKEFEISNGTLKFLSSNYGMFECFASNSLGTSYSAIVLTKHETDVANPLKLRQGPEHLTVSENSVVKFCCEIEGGGPAEFSWTFNTAAVDAAWEIEEISDTKQIMVVDGVNKVGTVGCLVTQNNEKVYQEGSIVLSSDSTLGRMIAPEVKLETETENLSLLEGSSLNLTCRASGSPDPALAWSHHQLESVASPFLYLENLSSEMSGEYRCTARNAAGIADKSAMLSVFAKSAIVSAGNEEPRTFLIYEQIQLTCQFTVDARLIDETKVDWSKSGSSLENRNVSVGSTSGSSTLTISNLTMTDAGTYTCRVNTPLDSISADWEVEIVYPPTILNLEPSKVVLLGSLAILSCETDGSPAPAVTWLHNNSEVPMSDLETGGRLTLDPVALDQAGEYTCRARNQYGTEQKTFSLAVAQPTTPIIEHPSGVVEEPAGADFELLCSGSVDPLLRDSAMVSWTKDNLPVPPEFLQGRDRIRIPYLLSKHSGTYTCEIKTLLDVIRSGTELRVQTLEPQVLSPVALKIGKSMGSAVSIKCSAVGIPSPTLSFKFNGDEYSGRVLSRTSNHTISVLDVGSVSAAQEGEYSCLAVNEYGSSQGTAVLDVYSRTTILDGPADKVLKSGESTLIPCKVETDEELLLSLRVFWLKNQSPVSSPPALLLQDNSLQLQNLSKSDEGIYSCVAETREDRTSLSGRLTVLSEAPTFSSTPRDIRILEDRNTELVCRASGIPKPVIRWTFRDQVLKSDEGVLPLSSLSQEKEGNYVCTAENIYGSVSEVVNLQVIKGAKRENRNLIPDVVKNIKETISLPCDFKLDQRIEEEARVIWTREGDTPISNSDKYQIERNKSLTIKMVELADGGQYTCKVITPLQEVQSKISLIVSGESPEILESFNKVTVHEGDGISLSCRARGVPLPNIEWLLKDRPVSAQYISQRDNPNNDYKETTVDITKASKSHEGVYQCVAKNNVGTVVKNYHVRVLKRTKVSIFADEDQTSLVIPAGQKLKLPCNVENDEMNRITRILWTKDDQPIEVGGEDIIDFGMDGSITIFNVQKRHEGQYKCTVTTVLDQESAEIPLEVLVNAPVITQYSKDQFIFSGTTIVLECIGTGIPDPEIRWTFNRTITKVTGPTFNIKNAISADSGLYTCTAKNSIGETQRTIVVTVVTLPITQDVYRSKQGSVLKLPCVEQTSKVKTLWLRDGQPLSPTMKVNDNGWLVLRNLSSADEGKYTCRVVIESGRVDRLMEVKLMPDILTIDNTRLEVKEGDSFTLKCDVLSGVNAKRMWKKDGQLVFPESGSGLDILQQGGVLTVKSASALHSGEWECIASTAWGQDSIIYWLSVPTRTRQRRPCSVLVPPVIKEVVSTSNTSVVLEWEVLNFNSSCFQEFLVFWWSKEKDSTHDNQTVELKHRKATINGLKPNEAYYFQVNLVRDKKLKDYMYGQTKSHIMQFIENPKLSSDAYPKAVIIIVTIVIVFLASLLVLLYLRRESLTKYFARRGGKARKQQEFSEFSSKLVANPDFMASLAPQWPEPEPETHAFIQRPLSRRGSRTSITSSWSSLFNVVSHEDIHGEGAKESARSRKRAQVLA